MVKPEDLTLPPKEVRDRVMDEAIPEKTPEQEEKDFQKQLEHERIHGHPGLD